MKFKFPGKSEILFFAVILLTASVMVGCGGAAGQDLPLSEVGEIEEGIETTYETELPAASPSPVATKEEATPEPEATQIIQPTVTLRPDEWMDLPITPEISDTAREIYSRGLKLGNNPKAFSKVGDCESVTEWFLADFDKGEAYYSLGEYQSLQKVIDYFSGSYKRLGEAAKPGFTAASVMTPLWADREVCEKDESPLACEFRLHQPSFIFITLGTNDVANPDTFETNMRRLIEYSIEQGVVPILSTKGDNLEGNHQINATIASLAYEYDLPLWNFWKALQPLPDYGLQDDGAHLTFGPNQFDRPEVLKRAWPVRNLTALQLLDNLHLAFAEK